MVKRGRHDEENTKGEQMIGAGKNEERKGKMERRKEERRNEGKESGKVEIWKREVADRHDKEERE